MINSKDPSASTRKLDDTGIPFSKKNLHFNQRNEYSLFEKIFSKTELNSSFSKCHVDFQGDLIASPNKICTNHRHDLLVTKKPSIVSRGFDNTFKLLENQVNRTNRKAKKALQSICQGSFSGFLTNSTLQKVSKFNPPARLDLEFEAIERLNSVFSKDKRKNFDETSISFKSMINFLCEFNLTRGVLDKTYTTSSQDFSHIYFVSRGSDGNHHLKVARSLFSNKVLCGNRVSQMTRAYDDIEAVTRLLEEKEKDLELTVQIGKELLTQNNTLEIKITNLEAVIRACNDDRAQLLHELQNKNALIGVLTNDVDEDTESLTSSKSISYDLLQKKVAFLQDENNSLKVEAHQLACQTDEVEEQERKLMSDITAQLHETNSQYDNLSLELEQQREENRLQHEQIVNLTARLAEAEMRLDQMTNDNDEHITLLNITKENQNCLALELVEFKQRYQEVFSLLQEAQEKLRKQRRKCMPHARSSLLSTSGLFHPDSLHLELMESSLYSDNSLDSGIAGDNHCIYDRIGRILSNTIGSEDVRSNNFAFIGATACVAPPYKKAFETVRCAYKNNLYIENAHASLSQIGSMSISNASGPRMSSMPYISSMTSENTVDQPAESSTRNSLYNCINMRSLSCESIITQSNDRYPLKPSGVPGAPGAKDLESALKRLTPAEVLARRAMLSYAPLGTYTYDENPNSMGALLGIRTPDSIMSTGSSGISSSTNMSMVQWRLPDKLQIVKPMEGSHTLNHWSKLATPTLSGLLEERPGVTIRGGRGLDELGIQIYTLSDVEEDVEELPRKQFEPPGCIYTYTTSTVMHPDDGIVNDSSFLSQSQVSSKMASASTSRQPSCPSTPRAGLSRRNSCSTFSVNVGLATMLNERGIKAVTPSALNTPAGPNFSPTVTPCNSPEGSPTRSLSPEPLFGILSSGADLIRRKLAGGLDRSSRNQQTQQKIMLSRLERRALRSLKLVEKVESIGLENIILTQPNSMYQLSCGIANRSTGPMTQLTSLKHLNNVSSGEMFFDRDQIKGVLKRGLNASTSDSDYASQKVVKQKKEKNMLHYEVEKTKDFNNFKSSPDISQASNLPSKYLGRQKSRKNFKNGISTQRPDLGTIANSVRKDLGKVLNINNHTPQQSDKLATVKNNEEHQSITQSFVGSVSSLLFGRKGGWL